MLDKEIVRLKVTGDFACFTRPDLKVERMSYPCMTPSAARGILEAILWKPEFQWFIRKIIVLNPIKFASIKRNEISKKQNPKGEPIDITDIKNRAQRNSIVLKDVGYIIEASVFVDEKLIVSPHVSGMDLQQIVGGARHIVALRHLRQLLHHLHEILRNVTVHTFQLHVAEHDEALVQLLSIQHSNVFLNISVALQAFEALIHRR